MQIPPDGAMDKDKQDEAIKARVKTAIKSKNLKIKQFARESGMAYPSLRDYYSGLRKPGFDAIAAIVAFTGVSADWLLLGKGSMFPDEESRWSNINENLLASIARDVALEHHHSAVDVTGVGDEDPENYLYSPARRELTKKLNLVREHMLIAANVYNRVAHMIDEDKRDELVKREVENMVRLYRNLSQSLAEDQEGAQPISNDASV